MSNNWNETVSALEVVAAARHATLLVVDETKASLPIEAIQRALMLLNQEGCGPDIGPQFRVPLLSLSDQSYCELAFTAGIFKDKADLPRLIDVPLADGLFSSFENLHGAEDVTEFSVMVRNLVCMNYGQAFRYLNLKSPEGGETEDA